MVKIQKLFLKNTIIIIKIINFKSNNIVKMGLDSVELIFQIERKFSIDIPDEDAVKIYTLQILTDYIASIKKISLVKSRKITKIRDKILFLLKRISGNDLVNEVMPISKILNKKTPEKWTELQKISIYEIPKPNYNFVEKNSIFGKLQFWKPNYNWHSLSVKEFIDAIIILNFHKIIDFSEPNSAEEIYFGIAGITSENMGIDPYEISPDKRFTKDLGID